MAQAVKFEAQERKTLGTGPARELRRQGRVPAVIYGQGQTPLHISLPLKELTVSSNKKSFKSTVFEISLNGKKINTVAKDISFDKVTDVVEHVDLQVVSDKTAFKVFVPVNYSNHAKAPGLKRGGVLNVVRRDIEFYVKPNNIPDSIEVDLTGLEIGHAIHVNDLKLPEGVRPVMKRNFTIVTIVGKGADEPTASAPGAPGAADATAAAAPGAAPAAPGAAPAADAKAPAADAKKADAKK